MHTFHIAGKLAIGLLGICMISNAQDQRFSIDGRLDRMMAIGGESTGWSMQVETKLSVGGRPVESIEVDADDRTLLEKFGNQKVTATGSLVVKSGVETGNRIIFVISDLKTASDNGKAAEAPEIAKALVGTEWLLEDLAGRGVIDRAQATLTFLEGGKVAGRSSCNRFSGEGQIEDNTIKIGRLVGTRMACPDAVMNQEAAYMKALEAAQRVEIQEPYLLIHTEGHDKPLKFTRLTKGR